jgi:hypothetical protein
LKAIQVKLTEGETYRAVPYAGGKQDLDCYLKTMEALSHVQRANIEDTNVARPIAAEAIATRPEPIKPYNLMAANPKLSLDNFAKVLEFKDRTGKEKIITALRKAGLPN